MVGCADSMMTSYLNLRSIAEVGPKVAGEHLKIDVLAWKKEQDSVIFIRVVGVCTMPRLVAVVRHVWNWR
jgi:hypothetical protein